MDHVGATAHLHLSKSALDGYDVGARWPGPMTRPGQDRTVCSFSSDGCRTNLWSIVLSLDQIHRLGGMIDAQTEEVSRCGLPRAAR